MRVSIVIPTRNRAHLLERTLQSVAAQDHADWECVVVDDGGSDDTAATVERLGDSRFRYFWKAHGERGAARNHGVVKATGDYVYFLDSDDWVAPFHVSHGLEIVRREGGAPIVHARFATVDEQGNLLAHHNTSSAAPEGVRAFAR
jgi:glycosyltransferase involved in cell wall biosynthesis